jgi:ketosteroid isomerase-like protein
MRKNRFSSSLALSCLLFAIPSAYANSNHSEDLFPQERAYLARSDQTKAVAEPYFSAYIARDWAALETLMHTEVSWRDPTAEQLFAGMAVRGKSTALDHLRKIFSGILNMDAHVTRRLFSANHAIFESALDWTSALENGKSMTIRATPFVVVLRIQDGKVVEHTDYADYHGFISEYHRSRRN